MQTDYCILDEKDEIAIAKVRERLELIAHFLPHEEHRSKKVGRNLWTRSVDKFFGFVRKYLPPLHWLGLAFSAVTLFIYIKLVAVTARLITSREWGWPNLPSPGVIALWHGDAPSLLIAFARARLKVPTTILIANDPRGDFLTLLCRMLRLEVVRTSGIHGDLNSLIHLAGPLKQGGNVIITADGGGPAQVVKVGAIALAAVTGVPLVPLTADCCPGIRQIHKWDAPRNPLPFSSIRIWVGPSRRFEVQDRESLEAAITWLQDKLNNGRISLRQLR